MSNTFKDYLQSTYSHNELADMANHGANTGHHGLIWTKDLVALYKQYDTDIHEAMFEYHDATGEFPAFVKDQMGDADQFQSSAVYFAVEWIAQELTQGEYVEETEA